MSFICTSCTCTGVAMSLLTKEIEGEQNLPALNLNVELKPTLSNKNFEQTPGCLEKESSRPPDSIHRSSMCSGGHECMYTSTCIGLVTVKLKRWCTECIHT